MKELIVTVIALSVIVLFLAILGIVNTISISMLEKTIDRIEKGAKK